MSVTTPFEPIAEVFERNLSIRHVYAEPVQHGDTTVIPVAKVAYGFGAGGGRRPALPAGADLMLGFSSLTWPHQLVRIMLAEQLYRATTILSGHPYHRE